jgi:hypothetical protein
VPRRVAAAAFPVAVLIAVPAAAHGFVDPRDPTLITAGASLDAFGECHDTGPDVALPARAASCAAPPPVVFRRGRLVRVDFHTRVTRFVVHGLHAPTKRRSRSGRVWGFRVPAHARRGDRQLVLNVKYRRRYGFRSFSAEVILR